AAERKSINCRDHGLAEIFDEIEHFLPEAAGLFSFDGGEMSQLADVRSRDEGFVARSGQYDAVYLGVIPRFLEGRTQVLPRLRVQCVQHLGAVESDVGDGALLLVQYVVER